jgi:hypothetical protein
VPILLTHARDRYVVLCDLCGDHTSETFTATTPYAEVVRAPKPAQVYSAGCKLRAGVGCTHFALVPPPPLSLSLLQYCRTCMIQLCERCDIAHHARRGARPPGVRGPGTADIHGHGHHERVKIEVCEQPLSTAQVYFRPHLRVVMLTSSFVHPAVLWPTRHVVYASSRRRPCFACAAGSSTSATRWVLASVLPLFPIHSTSFLFFFDGVDVCPPYPLFM